MNIRMTEPFSELRRRSLSWTDCVAINKVRDSKPFWWQSKLKGPSHYPRSTIASNTTHHEHHLSHLPFKRPSGQGSFTMDNAIACNVRATFKMESRDYEEAFNLLRTSVLSLLTGTSPKLPAKDSQSDSPSLFFSSSGWQPGLERFYSGSFLFTRGVATDAPESLTKREVDFCSSACLYNMALACHLEYEVTQEVQRRSSLLAQARTLYLTSYELLQKYPIPPSDSVVLLLMALCTNLMDIEMEFGSLDEVRFWRKILEDASYAADPVCFRCTSVFCFFESIYVAPGEMIAACAA